VFADQHPDLFTKLERVRKFRNKLAHARLDTNDAWMSRREKDRIQITYFKNGKSQTEVITVEESNKLLGETTAVMFDLIQLQHVVVDTPNP